MYERPTSAAVSPLTPVVISGADLSGSAGDDDFNWQKKAVAADDFNWQQVAADGHVLPEIAWWRDSGSTAYDRAEAARLRAEVARLHLCAVAQANRDFLAGGAA